MTKKEKRLLKVRIIRSFLQIFLIASIAISLVGMQPVKPVQAAATTVNLTTPEDTYLRNGYPTRNYGGTTTVSISNSTHPQYSLYKWDLAAIPSGSTVTAASMTFYVTDASAADFNLFSMRRAWVEGTSSDAESSDSANWNTYDGSSSWGTAGAMNTSSDRFDTDLWDATGGSSGTFSASGSVTIPLNASGVSVVQGWVTSSSTNFGVTTQFTGTQVSSADYWIVTSKENTSYAAPTLNVTYEAAGPTYTLSVNPGANGTVALNPPGGSYPSGTMVTLTATPSEGFAFDSWSGDLSSSTNPATITMNGDKSVSALWEVSLCTDITLDATEDTWLRQSQTTRNYGADVQLNVNGSSYAQVTLIRWNLTGLPSDATITDASLTLQVLTGGDTTQQYYLYDLLRAWVEGTNNDADGTGASWNYYGANVNSWATAGAQGSADRNSTNLWTAGTSSFNSVGSKTVDLNTSGIAVLNNWYNTPTSNNGFIISNTAASSDYLYIASTEDSSNPVPKLNLTYCVAPTGPTITTTGTLTPFVTQPGVASDPRTYTVSGVNLDEAILITAPAGFLVSTDGTEYYNTRTLVPDEDGLVEETTIYVILHSSSEGSFGGDIAHASTDATTKNVAVEGTVSNQICYKDQEFIATADTYISGSSTGSETNNYGASKIWRVALGATGRSALLQFDLSDLPANAVVSEASLRYYVSRAGSATFSLYNMRRAWVEGTGDGSVTNDGATWRTTDGSTAWGTNGAADTTEDRYDTNLWDAGTSSFTPSESKTVLLNASGVGVIQDWIDDDLPNYGLIIQNYATGSTYVEIDSIDNGTTADPPTLILDYCVGDVDTYTLNVAIDPASSGSVTLTPSGGTYIVGSVITLTPAPASGYQFSSWSGADAGDIIVTAGTYTIVMDEDKAITANFSLLPVPHAPNAPTLVRPTDVATDVAIPPILEVTVSDPDNDSMDVSFYGREVGTQAPAEDFLLIAIPDTQANAQYNNTVLQAQFDWIANRYTHPSESEPDLVFVTHLGDLVNTSSDATQWSNIDGAFDKLDPAGVPYSVGPGNHDIAMGTTSYSTYFGLSRFSAKDWYKGYYTSGADNYNNYSFFRAGGMDFILINLQYQPTSAMLDWADGLLKTNSDRRGIVAQHDILNTSNGWNNQASYTALSDNPNLFLMLCGHMHSGSDGSAYSLETRAEMDPVHVLLTDYQDLSGQDYVRLLTFKPSVDQIYAQVYSPVNPGGYLISETNFEQFTMDYNMVGTAEAPFELIGKVEDVASGAKGSISWTELEQDTEYEWYAVANDAGLSTNSLVWSFTTAAVVNTAPVLDVIGNQSVNELVELTFTAHAEDADTLTYSLANGTSGTVPSGADITAGGIFTWIPTEAQGPGSYTFDVCVSDGALSDCETITVTVREVNVAPVLDQIGDRTFNELTELTFTATATDSDLPDQTLTYSLAAGSAGAVPTGASITSVGVFSWTPTEAQGPGSYTFDVCVSDGSLSECETITVTVSEVNLAPNEPVLVQPFNNAMGVSTSPTLEVTVSDQDDDVLVVLFYGRVVNANPLPYSFIEQVKGVTSGGHASISWTGLVDSTEYEWYARVDDVVGEQTTSSIWSFTTGTGASNQAPVITEGANTSVTMSEDGVPTAFILTLNATDGDSTPLTWGISSPASHGTANASGTGLSKDISYTPNANYNGTDSFVVQVSDGSLSDTITVNVTIEAVNDAPVITGQAQELTVPEETDLEILSAHVTVTDVDNDYPQDFTLTVLSGDDYQTSGNTITPNAGFYGDLTVPVEVNDGQDDSNTYNLTVTVTQGGVTPVLPSNFWGRLHFASGDKEAPTAGDTLYAYLDSGTSAITSVAIGSDESGLTYAVNVPAYTNGTHPTTVTFKIDGRVVAIANWDSGTNVELNLHPPMANAGGPYVVLVTAASVSLNGAVTDVGNDFHTTHWDLDEDGDFDDASVLNPIFSFSLAGTYAVSLKAVDEQGGEGYDTTQVFAITLSGLTGQVYNGNPHPITVTGIESPFTYNVLYGNPGAPTAPTAAGTYDILVQILSGTDVIATYTTQMVIAKATATITLASLSHTYDGTAKAASATTVPDSLTVNIVYDPASPLDAGSYTVTATINNSNYEGTATNTLVIAKATATITLASLSHTYDGTAKAASATTDPIGLTVSFVYDPVSPLDAGSYAVTATITDPNYTGSNSGTLVIAKATASVTLGNLEQTYDGSIKAATATTAPAGLTVSFVYDPASPLDAGSYAVAATIDDPNYTGSNSGTLVIAKATATITLASLSHTYDGTAKAASATTVPADLTVNIVYDPASPLNAGSYAVTATINDSNYMGSNSGTLVIAKATASVTLSNLAQPYDGTSKPVTVTTYPTGLTVDITYDGSSTAPSAAGSYAVVATVTETNYTGSASGILVISGLSHNIDLVAGWNLVSCNLTPAAPDIEHVLAGILDDVILVYGWNGETDTWMRFDPVIGFGNSLTELNETMGFWINMEVARILTVNGTAPTTSSITLYKGWNLIGWPSDGNENLPAALAEIYGNYDLVLAYHANDTADPWKLFDLDAPDFANDLTLMAPGWGYWINMTVNDTLQIGY